MINLNELSTSKPLWSTNDKLELGRFLAAQEERSSKDTFKCLFWRIKKYEMKLKLSEHYHQNIF